MSSRFYGNPKGSVSLTPGRGFQGVNLDNRVKTRALRVTVSGGLDVSGAITGQVRNRGLASAGLQFQMTENGNVTYGLARMRILRALAEAGAAQSLYANSNVTTPLGGGSGTLAVGQHAFREVFDIAFADPRSLNPMETAYMEATPNSFLTANFQAVSAFIACLVDVGAADVELTSLEVSVEQMADSASSQLPFFKPWYQESELPVNGVAANLPLYIKTRSRVRSVMFAPEVVMADGGVVEAPDVITALRLIGDGGANIIGANQQDWRSLVAGQAASQGGQVSAAYFLANFQEGGWLSRTILPEREYPNFRAEMATALSAILGSNSVVIAVNELTRTPPNASGYATVCPPQELPAWAQ